MQKWERDILAKAINEYGDDSQLDMCIEEMSELTKEICKKKSFIKKVVKSEKSN